MRTAGAALVCIVAILLGGCMRAQKYVKVTPYGRRFNAKPTATSIAVVLEAVPDRLVVKGAGLEKMEVNEFRRSLGDCLKAVLAANFAKQEVAVQREKLGAQLVVHRVAAEWQKVAATTIVIGTGYRRPPDVSIAFTWDATLYLDGKKLAGAEGQTTSQQSTMGLAHVSEVYADGLKLLCEDVHRKAFSEEAQHQLADPTEHKPPTPDSSPPAARSQPAAQRG